MSTLPFAHLHCHSHYSLLDGAGTIRGLLERAKALRMTALALTDHGNLHGAIKFYQAAKELGINPILGLEAYIAPGSRFFKESAGSSKDANFHLTLLARNRDGFRNLVKLSSAAFLEGFYFKPRIDKELLAAHKEGLICLSGCVSSELSRTILAGGEANMEKAAEIAAWFQKLFGNDYYIELQNNNLESQRVAMQGAIQIANRLGIPMVATSDVHYIHREDAEAQDILLCVNTGKFRTDTNRMRMDSNEFYLRSAEEMYAAFPGLDDALRRTQEIADSVEIELAVGQAAFPGFCGAGGQDLGGVPPRTLFGGAKQRYANRPDRCADGQLSDEVMARLDRELEVINKLGFSNYFLIVWDFVRFARQTGHSGHGPRLGRRLAGFLRLAPQPRLSAGVRPAVRAFLGREPPRGARYRHRLLPAAPQRGDPIREGQVRRGERGADRHVRHAGGSGGDPRRGPRPGPAHPTGRRHRGDGARGTRHHAGKGPGKKRRSPEGPRHRRRGPQAVGSGPGHRGPGAERRHPCRRRGDRRPAADRLRPPATRAGQEGSHYPVGDGRRGTGRPAENGFSRPAEPHHSFQSGRADRADHRPEDRPVPVSARRPGDVRPALPRRDEGRVPVGERRHPRPVAADEARPLPRRHRHQRPVSPRAAGRRHGRRLHPGEARPQAGRVQAPGDEGNPGRDPRRDGLPGAGDADPQPPGRHPTGQRL